MWAANAGRPSVGVRVAAQVEGEHPVGGEVGGDGDERGLEVVDRRHQAQGVLGREHQPEAFFQPHGAEVGVHQPDLGGSLFRRAAFVGGGVHAFGRLDGDDPVPAGGERERDAAIGAAEHHHGRPPLAGLADVERGGEIETDQRQGHDALHTSPYNRRR